MNPTDYLKRNLKYYSEKNKQNTTKKSIPTIRPNPCILAEVREACICGIPIQVEGSYYDICNLQEIPMLREEETYMKDYIGDEKGHIIEIILDRIRICND